MNASDWIKSYLHGSSPQQPGTRSAMLEQSGLVEQTLDAALERLYNQGIVNRVHSMRDGIEDDHYWLTGATPKAVAWRDLNVAQYVRRESAPTAAAQPKEATAMPQSDKPKTLLMLEFIEKHPGCTGKMLRLHSGAGTVDSYLDRYLNKGEIIKTRGDGHTSFYRLADGVTAELIYVAPKPGRGEHNRPDAAQPAKVQPETANLQPETAKPEVAQLPASNVVQLKPADTEPAPERHYTAQQVFVDATGQLIIQQPGTVRMVFPPAEALRIQKLLLAINLESLCA